MSLRLMWVKVKLDNKTWTFVNANRSAGESSEEEKEQIF